MRWFKRLFGLSEADAHIAPKVASESAPAPLPAPLMKRAAASFEPISIPESLSPLQAGALATERQRDAVAKVGYATPEALSFDQASAILSAREFAEAVMHAVPPSGSHNWKSVRLSAVDLIVRDPEALDRAISYSQRRNSRRSDGPPRPKKDAIYQRVAAHLSGYQ